MAGKLPPELEEAYLATSYVVWRPMGPLVARIGANCWRLDEMLAQEGHDSWSFISACNPGSRVLEEDENKVRLGELRNLLTERGYQTLPAEGVPDVGGRAAEESFLVLGLPEDEAMRICVHFEQYAFVHAKVGEDARLVITPLAGG